MAIIGRSKSIRQAIRLCVLVGLLTQSIGCTAAVVEAYRADTLPDPMYLWVGEGEGSEIQIQSSRWAPNQNFEAPFVQPVKLPPPRTLMLRPGMEGCRTYDVFVNDADHRLGGPPNAIAVHPVPERTSFLPDDRYPECTILLTFHRMPSRPGSTVIAATRAGVLDEIPSGETKPGWLFLTPLTVVADAAAGIALVGAGWFVFLLLLSAPV